MEFTTSTLGVALDAGTALVAEQVPDIVWALVVLFGAVIGIVVVKAVLTVLHVKLAVLLAAAAENEADRFNQLSF